MPESNPGLKRMTFRCAIPMNCMHHTPNMTFISTFSKLMSKVHFLCKSEYMCTEQGILDLEREEKNLYIGVGKSFLYMLPIYSIYKLLFFYVVPTVHSCIPESSFYQD